LQGNDRDHFTQPKRHSVKFCIALVSMDLLQPLKLRDDPKNKKYWHEKHL
jgi:hypothetical protein